MFRFGTITCTGSSGCVDARCARSCSTKRASKASVRLL
jgi:hypothetical protein